MQRLSIMQVILAALLLAGPARATSVPEWAAIIGRADDAASGPDTVSTEALLRTASRATLAMFEAANATDPRYASYLHLHPAAAGASQDAAIATAVEGVLAAGLPAQAAEARQAAVRDLAAIPDGAAKQAGIAAGRQAAAAALLAGGIDRPAAPYRPAATPGVWVPTALPSIPPLALAVKPWFLAAADAIRPPPPPALDSATFRTALAETRRLGGRAAAGRDAAGTQSAQFWRDADDAATMRQVTGRAGRSAVQNARLYALMALTLDDALQATAEAKFHYGFWRPVTAIRNADRVPATASLYDAAWEPLLKTPMHPEYPCGHCTHGAAFAAILAAEPGIEGDTVFRVTSLTAPGVTKTLTLAQTVSECSISRIYGGVHFRFSAEAGEAVGRAAAVVALRDFAKPVP